MIDPFEDASFAQRRERDALLNALDDLDVSQLSDEQLDRLAQIVDALALEIEQEYVRRDDPPGD